MELPHATAWINPLCDLVQHRAPWNVVLDRLLTLADARATGLWRSDGAVLHQLAFRAVPQMPGEVAQDFAGATRAVPLSATGLGIVKAVLSQQPTLATVDLSSTGLADSASWLVRFGAASSLAWPVRRGTAVEGVLAIATARPLTLGDDAVRGLAELATAVGQAWNSEREVMSAE
jgi:hypothetical protein